MIYKILVLLAIFPALVFSQDTEAPKQGERPKRERPRGGEHPAGDKEGRVFHFMNRLKNNDPERFEKLDELRKENPQEFRSQIKSLVQKSFDNMGKKPMKGKGPGEDRHWLRDLREKNPERYEELMKLREEDPGKFREAMGKEFGDRMKNKPLVSREKMEEIRELAQKYHQAEDGDKTGVKTSLEKALLSSFEEDLENRRKMAERLEAHLAEIKSQISEREEKVAQLVKEKLQMIISNDAFKVKKHKE
jgi:hypothetical protein